MFAIELLKEKITSNVNFENKNVTFLNPYSYLYYRKHKDVFNLFDVIHIDGILLVFLLRIIGIKTKRVSFDMTSIASSFFELNMTEGKTVYFIGSTEENLSNFLSVLKINYPKLKISGFRNGYFLKETERENAIKNIISLKPNSVVVGMGTPNQEMFLLDLRRAGWNGMGFTCGGFIHQTAKGLNYYPKWINTLNLRWLYRIIDEPKLVKRYMIYYPLSIALFMFDVLYFRIFYKKGKPL